MSARVRGVMVAGLLVCAGCCGSAGAQDFTAPIVGPPVGADVSGAWVETGVPPRAPGWAGEAFTIEWHGLPELTTRGLAAGGGFASARFAVAGSQTGTPELGWSALGGAVGFAGAATGVGVRAVARRDRTRALVARPEPDATGAEVGIGARASAGSGVTLWASAPQVWLAGAAPPSRRSLELGAVLELGELCAWWSRRAVSGLARGMRADHAAGIAIAGVPLTVWLEAQDQPLRGGLGARGRVGRLWVAASIASHPVLGETVRAGLGVGGGE
jgi:hypothetical protein